MARPVETAGERGRPAVEAASPPAPPRVDWDLLYRTGQYRRYWDFGDASPELLAFFLTQRVPEGAAALDLGCGAGHDALFLARLGFHTFGVDVSEEALRIARRAAERAGLAVTWQKADVAALPFADGSFHFLNDRGCLHYFPERSRRRYAEEAARVLAPGGALLLRGAARFVGATPIDAETLREQFAGLPIELGPVYPLLLDSEWGKTQFNMTVLWRR